MIAKLIVTGANREIAIARMSRSLNEFVIKGIKTTIPFQASILKHAAFRNGKYDIGWVEKFLNSQPDPPDLPEIELEDEDE
jgi:acetyl-CoA carboxylase biotin carboxylase subunit